MAHSVRTKPEIETETVAPPVVVRAPQGADPGKRKRILQAAVQTFGRRGFHEARIAEIASSAGVAEGTVYLYFKNKEDLLGVLFDENMDALLSEGHEIIASGETAFERLATLVSRHIASLATDRDLASVFQIELRRSARLVERFSRSKLVEYFRMLERCLRDGIAAGEFREDLDPRLGARIIFGSADELLSEWLLSSETVPYADGRKLIEALLLGFANPQGQPRPQGRKKGESR
jgi:TetR/AcrR family fatty acid metabolism transcriptional regulator